MSATVPVEITLEFTPNPNTLKYVLNRRLLAVGAENFSSREACAERSPLGLKLFALSNVESVMFGPNFISVNVSSQDNLRELNRNLMQTIKAHLESGETIVVPRDDSDLAATDSPIAKRIREIIDSEIRPAVAMDGGDITFHHFEDGIVFLTMMGACSGCPSSQRTLKAGIESRLRQELPEVQAVMPV